jgi:hypothetical protein
MGNLVKKIKNKNKNKTKNHGQQQTKFFLKNLFPLLHQGIQKKCKISVSFFCGFFIPLPQPFFGRLVSYEQRLTNNPPKHT